MAEKRSEEEVVSLIQRNLKDFPRDIEFKGFCGNYKNCNTKLQLLCKSCGREWSTTQVTTLLTLNIGCICKTNYRTRDWIGYTNILSNGSHLTVVKEKGKTLYVKCSSCSQDKELYPDLFRLVKSDWIAGKIPCGCSKSPRRSKRQYEILVRRRLESQGKTFNGFVGDWKGYKTSVGVICERGHSYTISSTDKVMSRNNRCKTCIKDGLERYAYGYYSERLEKEDTLYLMRMSKDEEVFYKIGRSFDVEHRISRLKCCEYEIALLATYQHDHQYIYKLEKKLHQHLRKYKHKPFHKFQGETECFTSECLGDHLVKYIFKEDYES